MRLKSRIRRFFFPPPGSSRWVRALPYATLGLMTLVVLIAGAYAWDYTNSPEFCGTVCHTMPPEFSAYLVSPHARIDCVECHIGRGFIATRITRKAGDIKHIVSLAFKDYEFPIRADDLRPARETCERCHFPQKFSDDSLREIRRFENDKINTPISIYLTLKTGGGSKREGLGRGIHWHIENQVFYLASDPEEQDIPYVRVLEEGEIISEYVKLGSDVDPASVDENDLKLMDCISCHNRITHLIIQPEMSVDQLMTRGVISPSIPEIRHKSIEVLRAEYASKEHALIGIAGLKGYYEAYYPDFIGENEDLIDRASAALQDYYDKSVFPEQNADWDTHADNAGHQESPGCFRCHDGEHLNREQEAIRLECNLCHSIPVVAGPSDFIADIEISRGPEPESHLNPNWIGLHRDVFDATCVNCHTIEDPGGTTNTSFCSNSACHGSVFEYAGFDAPALREILLQQLPQPELSKLSEGPLTFNDTLGPIFELRCGACHGEQGLQGLDLTTFQSTLAGGASGAAIVPGDPESSLVVLKLQSDQPHFAQFTSEEMNLLIEWILVGAPEGSAYK
jgi:nitrate/TMAO reductase-like tetraheme cytochrome c subunit